MVVLGATGVTFHRRGAAVIGSRRVLVGPQVGLATTSRVALGHHLLMSVDILVGVRGQPLRVHARLLRHEVHFRVLLLRCVVLNVLQR